MPLKLCKKAISLNSDRAIVDALKIMIEKKVSCILCHNDQNEICGILTERDILRKLSLLDVDIKLERKIRTIMTKKVSFVDSIDPLKGIAALHEEKGIRHFPVLRKGAEPTVNNIVFMVTVTDLAKIYLEQVEAT